MLLKIWALLFAIALAVYWFAVRGRIINWVGLFKALPGILLEVAHSIWLSIADSVKGLFMRKKKVDVDLDEYERRLS